MIVLDEQLLGRGIDEEISRWYRGAVVFVTELRPGTVIKDEAIAPLLRLENQPTFVTINEKDFWRRVPIDPAFCVVCFSLPDSRASEVPEALRTLLRHPELSTKRRRMGKVIRVTGQEAKYYSCDDRQIRIL